MTEYSPDGTPLYSGGVSDDNYFGDLAGDAADAGGDLLGGVGMLAGPLLQGLLSSGPSYDGQATTAQGQGGGATVVSPSQMSYGFMNAFTKTLPGLAVAAAPNYQSLISLPGVQAPTMTPTQLPMLPQMQMGAMPGYNGGGGGGGGAPAPNIPLSGAAQPIPSAPSMPLPLPQTPQQSLASNPLYAPDMQQGGGAAPQAAPMAAPPTGPNGIPLPMMQGMAQQAANYGQQLWGGISTAATAFANDPVNATLSALAPPAQAAQANEMPQPAPSFRQNGAAPPLAPQLQAQTPMMADNRGRPIIPTPEMVSKALGGGQQASQQAAKYIGGNATKQMAAVNHQVADLQRAMKDAETQLDAALDKTASDIRQPFKDYEKWLTQPKFGGSQQEKPETAQQRMDRLQLQADDYQERIKNLTDPNERTGREQQRYDSYRARANAAETQMNAQLQAHRPGYGAAIQTGASGLAQGLAGPMAPLALLPVAANMAARAYSQRKNTPQFKIPDEEVMARAKADQEAVDLKEAQNLAGLRDFALKEKQSIESHITALFPLRASMETSIAKMRNDAHTNLNQQFSQQLASLREQGNLAAKDALIGLADQTKKLEAQKVAIQKAGLNLQNQRVNLQKARVALADKVEQDRLNQQGFTNKLNTEKTKEQFSKEIDRRRMNAQKMVANKEAKNLEDAYQQLGYTTPKSVTDALAEEE